MIPYFLASAASLGSSLKAMHNHVFAVGQNDGLPCIFFAKPVGRAANREVLIEPGAIDFAGLVPISLVDLERDWARRKCSVAEIRHVHPAHGQADGLAWREVRRSGPVVLDVGAFCIGAKLHIQQHQPRVGILVGVVIADAGFAVIDVDPTHRHGPRIGEVSWRRKECRSCRRRSTPGESE